MYNLISNLDKNIVAGVVTHSNNWKEKNETINNIGIHYIFNELNLIHPFFKYYFRKIFMKSAQVKVQKIINETKPTHIVCVYPDLDFIDLGIQISIKNPDIEFIPYLHDTIFEGLIYKKYYKRAKKIQDYIIKNNKKILVMSEGMKDLFDKKYNCTTTPILHSFSEKIDKKIFINSERNNSMFWGGSVYSINKCSAKRFESALSKLSIKLRLSNANKIENLLENGLRKNNIEIMPFLSRKDYLNLLKKQDALLMAIDSDLESPVHHDELATIFPTKTIEYLMSGKPIIVNCPKNYFLSQFFEKYNCGLVIDSTDSNEMANLIDNYLNNLSLQKKHIENGFNTLDMFNILSVKKDFMKVISTPLL
jgi:hypothetical protein